MLKNVRTLPFHYCDATIVVFLDPVNMSSGFASLKRKVEEYFSLLNINGLKFNNVNYRFNSVIEDMSTSFFIHQYDSVVPVKVTGLIPNYEGINLISGKAEDT